MAIKEHCSKDVVVCLPEATVPEVAKLMRAHHVGDVIVIEDRDDKRVPLGIVTDRDLVLEAVAVGLDVQVFTAGDLMTTPVVSVHEDEGILETVRTMSRYRVRRIAVVDAEGELQGIVSANDLFSLLSSELALLSEAMAGQQEKEARSRR